MTAMLSTAARIPRILNSVPTVRKNTDIAANTVFT